MFDMDLDKIPTPAYVVDERLLRKNLETLSYVKKQTGCKILLAQKAFSMYSMYPLIGEYLDGTTASSLFEAKLGHDKMGHETHIFNPAYIEEDFDEIIENCDHIVFNSPEQFTKWKEKVNHADHKISCGLRINPEYSEVETDLYNPCFKYSQTGPETTYSLEKQAAISYNILATQPIS